MKLRFSVILTGDAIENLSKALDELLLCSIATTPTPDQDHVPNSQRSTRLLEKDRRGWKCRRDSLFFFATKNIGQHVLQKVYKGLPMEQNERKAHWANFLHCHQEQIEPISDVHSHMEMLNICQLAGISARFGRDLKWDNATEQIVGDDQANAFLARPYRAGYEIEMEVSAFPNPFRSSPDHGWCPSL